MMDDEARTLDALARMNETALPPYDGADISAIIRRVVQRRTRIQQDLMAMTHDLALVAAQLRVLSTAPDAEAFTAREQIAVDFADGALALERARLSLDIATKDLEYLRYVLL
ncbi:hypothetical protein GO986_08495 [Deinococcus sp. HMF7620]|uniref:Uncharacterized protein n=1 Tax=Deinococcus arboris TaxID=2682977 RepID=A0A7C9LTR4_9DEIO|nr:hypothetical protein [Deinococcus arboris]MVN86800.1 hypothetical protein [Deinococcus arboris]